MTSTQQFEQQTKALIDDLKAICADHGLGNDGNEFKVITQVFLYKFLNDKFVYEIKQIDPNIAKAERWEDYVLSLSDDEHEMLMMQLNESTAYIHPDQTISHLFGEQNKPNFADLFDKTLVDIAVENSDIFAVLTSGGEKVQLFDNLSKYVTDDRDDFCKAIINKLTKVSFEHIFTQKFDFYATIFEYLIKDYNSNSGGKYAEYFTPHAVAHIMARCLVPKSSKQKVQNVTCYDPSAGSGTLLMNLAHEIGEDKCMLYSQDISQKSSSLLRLNLVLNNLVHSIHNIIRGNTILAPYHKQEDGQLETFDYIVSNPPFKLDFSGYSEELASKENHERFFAGVPKVPAKKKESMAIYLMFLQHIIHSLKPNGKAAVVVPTGFITAQSGIDKTIRQRLVEHKMLAGVVSMPSNIFANTGTNVSILFIDKSNSGDVVLIDASNLGTTVKDGKNQKTVLSPAEEDQIIDTFNAKKVIDDFSVVVGYNDIAAKNYSLSAGQYFEVKIKHIDITREEFESKLKQHEDNLVAFFSQSEHLNKQIQLGLKGLKRD